MTRNSDGPSVPVSATRPGGTLDHGPHRVKWSSLLLSGALGTAAAAVSSGLLWWVATSAGDELSVTPPGQATSAIPLAVVIGAALVAGASATVFAAALARIARVVRPGRWFLAISTVVLVLSFASPFAAAEQTSTALWLSAMHLAVAGAVVPPLTRALPGRVR